MKPGGGGLARRDLGRKTSGGRGIGIHSLREANINDAIRNGLFT